MEFLKGKTIRLCLDCNKVYVDSTTNLSYIRPCKFCGLSTAFFTDINHFFGYIEKYDLDTDQITDKELLSITCNHFGIILEPAK